MRSGKSSLSRSATNSPPVGSQDHQLVGVGAGVPIDAVTDVGLWLGAPPPTICSVGEMPRVGSIPEVGVPSSDGSRVWNGQFWVRVGGPEEHVAETPALPDQPRHIELFEERRRFGFPGLLVAAVVGVVLTNLHFTLPTFGASTLADALSRLVIVNLVWTVAAYLVVIVILSLGERGVDVMLLRAMLVAFVVGAAYVWLSPLSLVLHGGDWLKVVLVAGLVFGLLVGPTLAVYAILVNFIWYRSSRSLRPQLGFFDRD